MSVDGPRNDVKGLGRWNSDAFMDYILSGARAKRARRIQVKLAGQRRRYVGLRLSISGLVGSSYGAILAVWVGHTIGKPSRTPSESLIPVGRPLYPQE